MRIKQNNIAVLISLLFCAAYIVTSAIFYRILEVDMPLILYVVYTFFIGLSEILAFYHIKFDKNISSKYKCWFYANTVMFVLLSLHFLQSADRKQRIVKDFNWSVMFEVNWKEFIPLGVIIVIFMIGSKVFFESYFFPIKQLVKCIRKHTNRNKNGEP